MEEGLLGGVLALQELDVVDEEDVDLAIAGLEDRCPVVRDRVDEVVCELLRAHVADADPGIQALGIVADRVQEMCLAEAGLAVDEERVVGLGRSFRDRDGSGVREPVGPADDEIVETVFRVEPGVGAPAGFHRHGALVLLDVLLVLLLDRLVEVVLGDVRVHDDGEIGDGLVVAERDDGVEEREANALLEHATGEVVGHLEVERACHDAARYDEREEAFELGSDAVVGSQRLEHGFPEFLGRIEALVHRSPRSAGRLLTGLSTDCAVTPP